MTNDLNSSSPALDVDHVNTQDLANKIRRTVEAAGLLDVSTSERVETMLSITRKPPRMQIRRPEGNLAKTTETKAEHDLSEIAEAGQDTVILGLASIVLRHESALHDVDNPKVLQGFDEVVMQLRMFEHLRVMTSAAGS